MSFTIGYHLGNLCDALLVTPIFKSIKDGTLEMYDSDVTRSKAQLFDNICKVVLTDKPALECPRLKTSSHRSQQMLDYLGLKDNYLPWIVLSEEEKEWGKKFINKYDNPLAFIPFNGASHDKTNFFAQARTFTPEMIDFFINTLKQKYTLLQFGIDNTYYSSSRFEFYDIDGVVSIKNLNLRQLAACYYNIGKMVSCDTGHPYLMIACGGKVVEIVPMTIPHIYPYWEYTYIDEKLWQDERIRAKYFDMFDYRKSVEFLNFDF